MTIMNQTALSVAKARETGVLNAKKSVKRIIDKLILHEVKNRAVEITGSVALNGIEECI